MTAIDYALIKGKVDEAIATAGKVLALRRGPSDANVYNTTTQSNGYDVNNASNDVPIKVVLLDFSDREYDGTVIRLGDRKALIAVGNLDAPPNVGDYVVDGTTLWRIVRPMKVSPAGVDVLYKAHVRA